MEHIGLVHLHDGGFSVECCEFLLLARSRSRPGGDLRLTFADCSPEDGQTRMFSHRTGTHEIPCHTGLGVFWSNAVKMSPGLATNGPNMILDTLHFTGQISNYTKKEQRQSLSLGDLRRPFWDCSREYG